VFIIGGRPIPSYGYGFPFLFSPMALFFLPNFNDNGTFDTRRYIFTERSLNRQ
jgi:hypothetical protein